MSGLHSNCLLPDSQERRSAKGISQTEKTGDAAFSLFVPQYNKVP